MTDRMARLYDFLDRYESQDRAMVFRYELIKGLTGIDLNKSPHLID